MWGLGAASWPLCVSIVARGAAPRAALFPLAAAAAVTSLVILSRRDDDQARQESRPGASVGPLQTVNVVLFGVVIFLYSGVEMALGGWLPEYARRASTVEVTRWAAVGTAFWGGLSAGRGAIAVRLESRHEDAALFAGLLLATAGVLVLLRVQSYALLPAIAGMCGFGLGPVFPVTAAAVSRRMPTPWPAPSCRSGRSAVQSFPGSSGSCPTGFDRWRAASRRSSALLALLIGLHVMRRAGERARDGAPGRPFKEAKSERASRGWSGVLGVRQALLPSGDASGACLDRCRPGAWHLRCSGMLVARLFDGGFPVTPKVRILGLAVSSVLVASLLLPAEASAQRRYYGYGGYRGAVVVGGPFYPYYRPYYSPFFYDPFFWGWGYWQ